MVWHGAKAARHRGIYDDALQMRHGAPKWRARRDRRTRDGGKRFSADIFATCQERSPKNPPSATLNALLRVSHLSGNRPIPLYASRASANDLAMTWVARRMKMAVLSGESARMTREQ
jgi:hypothetical protein